MRQDALPRFDGDEIRAHIQALSREPFREVLGRLLEAEPDPEKVKAFAERYPDRWSQAVTMMSRLSGFTEKTAVDHRHIVAIGQLSDSQLLAQLEEVRERVADMEAERSDPVPALPVSEHQEPDSE